MNAVDIDKAHLPNRHCDGVGAPYYYFTVSDRHRITGAAQRVISTPSRQR